MNSLTTNSAVSNDFDFCWRIYSESIRDEISPFIHGGWIEDVERDKFKKNWATDNSQIILLDSVPVGWFSVKITEKNIIVEHGYIAKHHQKKKIGSIILNFLNETARRDGKTVQIEVLKTSSAMSFFEKNGFSEKEELSLTSVMEYVK
jgi:GNAT superfamily N-acetyltransferase